MLPALCPLCSQWLVDYFATESAEFTEKFVVRLMALPSRPGIAHAACSVSSVISVAYRLLCHREHRVHREVRITPNGFAIETLASSTTVLPPMLHVFKYPQS